MAEIDQRIFNLGIKKKQPYSIQNSPNLQFASIEPKHEYIFIRLVDKGPTKRQTSLVKLKNFIF